MAEWGQRLKREMQLKQGSTRKKKIIIIVTTDAQPHLSLVLIFLLCSGKIGLLVFSVLNCIDKMSSNEVYSMTGVTDVNLLVEAGK